MSSTGTPESRKIHAIQTLEQHAWKFCTGRLNALFTHDIQAKAATSTDDGSYAHLCKNDILFILERVMSFEGPNVITSHSGLEGYAGNPFRPSLFSTPGEKHQGPSVTIEAQKFMKEYEKMMRAILAKYDAEKEEEQGQEQVPPGGRITNFFRRTGGYKRTSLKQRRTRRHRK